MGWLPSAPQLKTNPLQVVRDARRRRRPGPEGLRGREGAEGRLAADELRGPGPPGQLAAQPVRLALQPARLLGQGPRVLPQAPARHQHGVQGKDLGPTTPSPEEVVWHDQAPEGKLDLLVTLDFRMSTTCLYSDIVLPTATWYEKNDLNTSDMHPFIHPLSRRGGPGVAGAQRLGDLQGLRKAFQRGLRRPPGRREGPGADAADARHAGRAGAALRRQGLEARRVRPDPRQDRAADDGGRARLPQHLQALHRAGPADGASSATAARASAGTPRRGRAAGRAERRRAPRPDQGHAADRDRHRRLPR
jgi:hypothetical protein